ncbi:MAG: hypothetical protein AAF988_06620, partial [Pseudomonadota bacterium]
MSVDPLIQAPGNSQGINPYSYGMNNPLSFTDPTGYETEDVDKKPSKLDKFRANSKSEASNIDGGSRSLGTSNGSGGSAPSKPSGNGDTTKIMGQEK